MKETKVAVFGTGFFIKNKKKNYMRIVILKYVLFLTIIKNDGELS